MEPQRALFSYLILRFSAKQMPYPFVALVSFRAYPSYLCIGQPLCGFPYPVRMMTATKVSEDSRNFPNRYFMDDLFAELIPDGMQQERPQLPVMFRLGAFHTDDDNGQRDRDRCWIIGRYKPRVAGWNW